ncbi:MAG TPA: SDR family NAD(P)-dependent oxidoreductase, partial [Candidatus Binatia bacterium]
MELKDKVALITGGGRGIGKAVALDYAREGAKLAICARTAAEIEETAKQIQSTGADCLAVTCDVSQEEPVEKLIQDVHKRFGRIDV